MKHLMRFYNCSESNESNEIQDIIDDFFLDTGDFCSIEEEDIFFNVDNKSIARFRSNLGVDDSKIASGYTIEFNYSEISNDINSLNDYTDFINTLQNDCNRFIEIYKPTYYRINFGLNFSISFYKK